MNVRDKVVVITGAGRGLGRAMALHFAAAGGHVALLDLAGPDLEDARAHCAAHGVAARAYIANVTDEAAVIAAMDAVVADFGRLDVMINNAGITKDGLLIKVKDGRVVGTMPLAQWQAVIDVNLTGVFLCGREAAARMITLGNGGVIINISSVSKDGNFGQTNYSAAKAGVMAMADTWAKELARYGIRAATIAPGFAATDILSAMRPEVLDKVTAPVPLKRLGRPEEIAEAAAFIVANDFFTGRCIQLDGGLRL